MNRLSWWVVTLVSFASFGAANSLILPGAVAPNCCAEEFELADEVRDALLPLFKTIANADVSRTTVELSAESLIGAEVIESQTSTYQIGSISPDKFTVYLKEPDQRIRVYCDGEEMIVAMSPEAFFRAPEPIQTQQAATNLPVALGPYPEAVLSLSLAGVDPAISLLGGMKSVELVDRGKFRGEVPAIHFKGVQDDGVSWDFWITQGKDPKPLRLLVDLTPMLRATGQSQFPPSYAYNLRFDFLAWRMSGTVDDSLFKFTAAADAVEYQSLDDYYEKIAAFHPLLGATIPNFAAMTMSGDRVDSQALAGKIVVLDFWATWCAPCVESMPVLSEICGKYAAKNVVLFAVNTGESGETATKFVKEQGWKTKILFDPDGKVADAFEVDAIPQTVIIGPRGTIQSVHVGYDGEDALREQLAVELETLIGGGELAAKPTAKTPANQRSSN